MNQDRNLKTVIGYLTLSSYLKTSQHFRNMFVLGYSGAFQIFDRRTTRVGRVLGAARIYGRNTQDKCISKRGLVIKCHVTWDGVSGFGRIRWTVGFGRIPSSPTGDFFAVFYSLVWGFEPADMDSGFGRFGRGSDSDGFGRIRTDS
jgi:hypothetical protein